MGLTRLESYDMILDFSMFSMQTLILRMVFAVCEIGYVVLPCPPNKLPVSNHEKGRVCAGLVNVGFPCSVGIGSVEAPKLR